MVERKLEDAVLESRSTSTCRTQEVLVLCDYLTNILKVIVGR
jgi:hypothetical protein